MKPSWILSIPMLINGITQTLELKGTNIQRELFITIDEMTNILQHLWKKLKQQKEDGSNRIN